MDFIKYLNPIEGFGKVVVLVQIFLFIYCAISFFRQMLFLAKIKKQINSCADVTYLSNIILTSRLTTEAEADQEFSVYSQEVGLLKTSPIHHHLKSMFRAGFNQSNLDMQALLRNTSAMLTNKNQLLRSLISLFIVLGLLGTLWGLASSLFQFSNSVETNNIDNKVLAENVRLMLSKLSGAFAPSIWGVGLTVISVILFYFLQNVSQNISLLLESKTLGNWGLYLLPTTPQHLFKQLQRNEEQMQKNLEAAQKVGEFADVIRDDAQGLSQEVSDTRLKFKELRRASDNLIKFSEKFGESLVNFPTLQTDLHQLNQQMLEDSKIVRENFHQSLTDSEKLHQQNNLLLILLTEHLNQQNKSFNDQLDQHNKSFTENLTQHNKSLDEQIREHNQFFYNQYNQQNEVLNNVVKSLKLYEANYLETRQSIDATLIQTLSAVEKASEKLGQQNEGLIQGLTKGFTESIGNPLKEEISQTLGDIPSALSKTSEKLIDLKNPLVDAVATMRAITEQFDKRTDDLVGGLQREFTNRNFQNQEYLDNLKIIQDSISSLNSNLQIFTQKLENVSQKSQIVRQERVRQSNSETYPPVPRQRLYERLIPNFVKGWFNRKKR